jgi:hypothetical protein
MTGDFDVVTGAFGDLVGFIKDAVGSRSQVVRRPARPR